MLTSFNILLNNIFNEMFFRFFCLNPFKKVFGLPLYLKSKKKNKTFLKIFLNLQLHCNLIIQHYTSKNVLYLAFRIVQFTLCQQSFFIRKPEVII